MNNLIGDKTKSALDEMVEVSRQRNADVAEEERLEKLEAEKKGKAPSAAEEPVITPASCIEDITADYICMGNIVLKDADGKIIEEYPKLYVKRDIEKDAGGHIILFTPYKGIMHCEQQGNGLFLPSFGLTCNIIAALFKERQNPEIENILEQYKDCTRGGLKYGKHCQNTLIDWARNIIINYPNDTDFNGDGGNDVNVGKRYEFSFKREDLWSTDLEEALNSGNVSLKNVSMKRFARQFTMLEQPEMLVELGKYFKKPARLLIPYVDCKDTRATWLGCTDNGFGLFAYGSFSGVGASRGVRRSS